MVTLIWANLSSNRCLTSCPNLRVFFAPLQGGILWSAFYSCATSWPEHEPCHGLPPTKSLPLLYTLLLSAPRSYSSAHLSSSLSCGLFCCCSLKTNAKAVMLDTPCLVLHETLAVWYLPLTAASPALSPGVTGNSTTFLAFSGSEGRWKWRCPWGLAAFRRPVVCQLHPCSPCSL